MLPLGLFLAGLLMPFLLLVACTPQPAPQAGGPPGGVARGRPAVPVQTQPVKQGVIEAVLTYSGTIQPVTQVNVVARTNGIIDQLKVDVGSQVKGGEVIAVLDRTVLEAQVRQAEANLDSARARLAALEKGPKSEDVEAAQAQLEAARIRLAAMRAGGRAEEVASAEAALRSAEARLAQVQRGPSESDLQAAQSTLDTAEANLRSAMARLEQLRKGPSAADLQAAISAVETSKAQVASAEAALANVSGSTAADLKNAEAQVEIDRANLAAAEATLRQLSSPTSADLEARRAALLAAQAALESARRTREVDFQGIGSTNVCAKEADGGRKYDAACNLVLIADDAAVASAEAQVASAQAALDLLRGGGSEAQRRAAEAAVAQARLRLAADQARLEAIRTGSVEAQRAAAQSALVAARERLKADQARLEYLRSTPTEADLQAAQTAVEVAQASIRSATARLEQLRNGPTEEELAIAEAAVEQARQTLAMRRMPSTRADIEVQAQTVAQLEAQLRSRMNPVSEPELEQARAAVAAAQAALDVAKANLEVATVVAPFDGVISARHLAAGALAGPQTPIVTLMSNEVELVFNAEERQIARLQPGQPVTLSVPAYFEEKFPARIRSVAPAGDLRSHTFQVRVQPTPQNPKLLSGMFAEVKVVAERKENALLVPRDAIVRRADQAAVFVAEDGRAREVPLKLGLFDDEFYEVLEGLQPGAQIITLGQGVLVHGDAIRPLGQDGQRAPGQQTEGVQKPGGVPKSDGAQKPEGGQFRGKGGQPGGKQ